MNSADVYLPFVERRGFTNIERFARTLWMARYSDEGIFVNLAYASYWDASYGDVPKKTVVAGAAAPVHVWSQCEINWRLVLANYSVPYFHMKEFVACRGPYSEMRWKSEEYRASFLSCLAGIVNQATLVGIGRVLTQSVFDKANKNYHLDTRFNPFVICALECVTRAYKHIRKLYSDTAPIEYIFDQGDKGKGCLTVEMERRGLPIPIFQHSKAVHGKPEIKPMVQLQMADFVAWELRRANAIRDDPEFRGYRRSFLAIDKRRVTWGEYTDLEGFCRENNVEERLG